MTESAGTGGELVLSRSQLSRLLTYVDAAVITLDLAGIVTFASPGLASVAGYDPQLVVGRSVVDFLHPDEVTHALDLLANWGDRTATAPVQPLRVKVASGDWVPMVMDAVTGPDLEPFGGVVVTMRRVDSQPDIERELRQRLINEGRLVRIASAFVDLPYSVIDSGIEIALREMGGLPGVDRVEVVMFDLDENMLINTHEYAAPGVSALREGASQTPMVDSALLRAIFRHEEVSIPSVDDLGDDWELEREWFGHRHVGSAVAVPLSDHGRIMGFLGYEAVDREFTFNFEHLNTLRSAAAILSQALARHAADQRLAHQARHDPLTNLSNRWAFMERLAESLERIGDEPDDRGQVAVLLLDIDRFKVVNDSLGHGSGDGLLVTLSRRLLDVRPDGAMLARMGGDELALLLEGPMSASDVVHIAEELRGMIRRPINVQDQEVTLSASVGIAIGRDPTETPDDLLRHADVAMYAAKELGRDRVEVFDDSLRSKVRHRLQDEIELRHALEAGQLIVHYQPEVEVPTGRLLGAEALVRWQHPTRGLLPAVAFIDLAEETGLIVELGVWVLREACRQQVAWQLQHPDQPLLVRVNLSARQIGQPDLLSKVVAILRDTGIQPANLCLEITETTVMADAAASLEVLEKLRGLGVELAIDDFGTGYSSLSYLKRFPVDVLKVDRSFVDGLGSDPDDTAIVQAIMVLASSLGLRVTAEGVETDVQLRELLRLGCSRVQGYLFARPEPADAIGSRLGGGPLRPV